MRGVEQIPWFYDGYMSIVELCGLGKWRRKLLAGARGRVLEVGCGTGRNLPLYPPGVELVACDVHLEVIETARRRAPGVALVVATAEALPFRAGTIDTAISSLVFCSVPDPVRGLREIGRVLAPEGELRMMEHVRGRGRFQRRVQDRIQPFWTWMTGGCRPNRDTESNVEAAGFRIEPEGRREHGTMRLFTAVRAE